LAGHLGHGLEDRQRGHGLDVVDVVDAGHVEDRAAHLGGAADRLLDRVDAGDAAHEHRLPVWAKRMKPSTKAKKRRVIRNTGQAACC
jgi:hypothetical protein